MFSSQRLERPLPGPSEPAVESSFALLPDLRMLYRQMDKWACMATVHLYARTSAGVYARCIHVLCSQRTLCEADTSQESVFFVYTGQGYMYVALDNILYTRYVGIHY